MAKRTMSNLISGPLVCVLMLSPCGNSITAQRQPVAATVQSTSAKFTYSIMFVVGLTSYFIVLNTGCLIYELATLSPPFNGANERQLSVKIKAGKYRRLPSKFSDELQRTVRYEPTFNLPAHVWIELHYCFEGCLVYVREICKGFPPDAETSSCRETKTVVDILVLRPARIVVKVANGEGTSLPSAAEFY